MAPSLLERQLLRIRNAIPYYAGLHRVTLGQTPKDLVWRRETARLWRYRSDERRISPPILIVHSLVSESHILDLLPGNSMVAFLCEQGFDVFLTDWERAGPADADNTLQTYVDDYLPGALAAVRRVSGADEVTVVGYCLGGVLALLLGAAHPELPIRNLVTMTTPCDFRRLGFMTSMLVADRLDPDDVIDDTGLVPARFIDLAFQSLKPTDPLVQQANVWQHLHDEQWLTGFIAMNRWAREQLPFPGAAFRQLVDVMIRDNALLHGVVPWGDDEVRLADIHCPYLNVFCNADELVPPASAEPLCDLVGSEDRGELRLDAGHVGLVAGRQAAEVSRPRIAEWVGEHSA
ncbi:MAG: alpha/beta fold hydrolase [Solirubrobacterales bacterium]|nr:alpha/beta fold hydrolase [Solirubrobacterales bacterium]